MIQTILQALDQAAAEHLPVGARYLLVEQQRTGTGVAPHRYDGSGRWTPIANDNAGTFSYWRLTSPIKEQEVDAAGCYDVFEAVYSLRLVAMVDRSLCPDLIDVARGAATAVRGTDDGIRASLKLRTVDFGVSSVEVNSQRVYTQEFGGTLDVNPDKALVSIDIAVTITGKSICFAPCEGTADYLCGLIEAQTWQRIKGCMTEAQIAAATADLCDDAPCDPLSVRVNGEPYDSIEDPCGGIATVTVTQGGVNVGELIDGEWVIPECPVCDPMTINLVNTDDDLLETQEVDDCCGQTVELVAPDATVTFDGLDLVTVPSGDTVNIDCGTNIESAHVTLGGSAENGIYYISGTAGGKTRYEKDANHAFEYSGTRWVLIRTGSDHQAALGNETYPWLADWTGTGIAVDEGTISQYCGGNIEPCADLTITVNDEAYGTVANPCGATADVDVQDSDGNPVGSLVGGVWVVPTLCDLIGDVAAADIETEVIDCMDDDQKAYANVATTCDLDAQAWIAQVEAIDGQVLEAGVRKAVCDLVTGLKADGIWTKLKAVGLLSVARTFDAAFVPLKGTAPTAFNFVSGDYDRKTGLVGNGSSKYLSTNRNNNADPQDDQAMGVWIHSATQAGSIVIGAGGADTGSNNIGRRAAPNDSDMFVRNRNTTFDAIASVGTATAYVGMSRTSSTGYTLRASGSDVAVTRTSQTPYNNNIGVFASIASGIISYSSARMRFYHVGEGITLADLDSRLTTFFTAVDAIMP